MRNLILSAILCQFALTVQANTITLDSLNAGVASATAYTHGVIDSGEAQLIYRWDFLPNFLNPNLVSGSVVTGVFTQSDVVNYLPANYTLYFQAGVIQEMDTIWAPVFLQATILDTPVMPIFTITSTLASLTGAIQTYYYNSGNVLATVTPYISYVSPIVGFNPHEALQLNGEGNGNYSWNGFPTQFTFWCYFIITNQIGTVITDTFSITTLSEPAAPWISMINLMAPPDSIKVQAIVMGNTLPTTITVPYSSSNGASGTIMKIITGLNLIDTVWLTAGGVGMETEVQIDLCASNSMGYVCVGEMITTTNTKAFVSVDSFHATTWNHGVAYCTAHVPDGSIVNTGYILSKNESLLPIIDQSDTMRIHYQTESYQIQFAGLYDQIDYYLYLYGNATDGSIFDTLFYFQFDEAGVSSVSTLANQSSALWCDGNIVTINSDRNQRLTISSVLGVVRELKLSPGNCSYSFPSGLYTYKFDGGESGKFLITPTH